MFDEIITHAPLTSPEANEYFYNKITGETFDRDESFLATLRALLDHRMNEDDPRICLAFRKEFYTKEQIKDHEAETIVKAITEDDFLYIEPGNIYVYSLSNSCPDNNKACMEAIRDNFTKLHSGWHELPKVMIFFKKSFGVSCFVNPDSKNVALFCDSLNMRKLHYLQCGIFAFLPWYFDPDESVSEEEMELIKSLREKDSSHYKECIENIALRYDFRTERIKSLLAGFETRFDKEELEKSEINIEAYMSQIKDLNERIGVLLKSKYQTEVWALGLREKIAKGNSESELMEYFLHNKNLSLITANDSEIKFSCWGYLEYFNEDAAERIIRNHGSYIYVLNYESLDGYISEEDMEKLMTSIFIDQTLRIRFCSTYRLPIHGEVCGVSEVHYGYEFRECMPNPHIDYYSCIGDYYRPINQAIANHDYIMAIEQCVASCKALNLTEAPTMEKFIGAIYGYGGYTPNNRCIELPDGSVVVPEDAIEWLKSQEGEK